MGTPTSVSELYPSKWLKPDDLKGRAVKVTVAAVTVEDFRQPDGSTKPAAVVAFAGASKRLILNKTQCQALADLTGSEAFGDWVGRAVMLAPATAQNGKPTIAIRPAPAQAVARPGEAQTGATA